MTGGFNGRGAALFGRSKGSRFRRASFLPFLISLALLVASLAFVSTNDPANAAGETFSQNQYRWYDNVNGLTPSTSLASQNTPYTLGSTATPARLRMNVGVGGSNLAANTQAFGLQYATSTGGPWSTVGQGNVGWWNNAWTARRKITINNSASTENLTNFPLRVSLSSSNIDYGKTQNQGQDIRFVDADGSTLLSHEIERWDESGTSETWVKVPQIDANSTTDFIWIYYGNAAAADGQATTSVWGSEHVTVYHLNEQSGQHQDSTANDLDMATVNVVTQGSAVGRIAGADDFERSNGNYLTRPHNNAYNLTQNFTLEAWVNPESHSSCNQIFSKQISSGSGNTTFWLDICAGVPSVGFYTSGGSEFDVSGGTISTGSLQHIVGTFDNPSNTLRLYVNGVQRASSTSASGTPGTGTGDFHIGRWYNANDYFDGIIDEPRVHNVTRSGEYIEAEYLSMNNSVNSFDAEESLIIPQWGYFDNPTPANGSTLSTTLLTSSTVSGSYIESATTPLNPNAIPVGGFGEWDFSLDPSNALTNTTYYFRMVKSDGSSLDTYTSYPEVTVGARLGQEAHRFFANANSTNVGSPLAAQDSPATSPTQGTPFRLRQTVHVSGMTLASGSQPLKLQYAQRSGTCDTGFVGEAFVDVSPSSGPVRYFDNASPADGSVLTTNANDPTSGHTKVSQTYEESNPLTAVNSVPTGQDAMWDFAVVDFSAAQNTTYCLRVVRANGTLLDSYTTIPQFTTAIVNAAPDTPSVLTQTKPDTSTLAVGAWTNTTTIRFTANATDPDSSDSLSLCVEARPLGTSFTSELSCGSAVGYSGSAVLVVHQLTVADQSQFHWRAFVRDSAGASSPWVSYGGNAESERDFGTDTTAPSGGTVFDGTAAGVDAAQNTGSLTELSANWNGFDSTISGLARYNYRIGTTSGGNEVRSNTDVGGATSTTATGLSLSTGVLYYFTVEAIDNAGNIQQVSSNGQIVMPTLSFAISTSGLSLGRVNAGNSYTGSAFLDATTSTNGNGGYSVRQYGSPLSGTSGTLANYSSSWASPTVWTGTGFGYTSSDTLVAGTNRFNGATRYAALTSSGPGDVVADREGPVVGTPYTSDSFRLTYRVTAPANQGAGNYGATVRISVTPNF